MTEINPAYAVSADDVTATNEQLKQVSQLVAAIRSQRSVVANMETQLKDAQRHLRLLEEEDLPAALDEAGIPEFKTADGAHVKVEQKLYMSVPKKNKPAVASWLLGHGHGSLVQSDVVVKFKKGEADRVNQAVDLLAEHGFPGVHVDESMHTGQLKALVRELLDDGEDVPLDLFGAYVKRVASVSEAKK